MNRSTEAKPRSGAVRAAASTVASPTGPLRVQQHVVESPFGDPPIQRRLVQPVQPEPGPVGEGGPPRRLQVRTHQRLHRPHRPPEHAGRELLRLGPDALRPGVPGPSRAVSRLEGVQVDGELEVARDPFGLTLWILGRRAPQAGSEPGHEVEPPPGCPLRHPRDAVPQPGGLAGQEQRAAGPKDPGHLGQGLRGLGQVVQEGVPDHQVEATVPVRQPFRIRRSQLDSASQPGGIPRAGLQHAGRDVAAVRLLDVAVLPQIQDEEAGPAAHLQHATVPAAREHAPGPFADVGPRALVERDGPLAIVVACRRVVVQEVGGLGVERAAVHRDDRDIQLERLSVRRRGQRPVNEGSRFSMKAFMPSFWSSVENRSVKVSRSITRPVRRSALVPQLIATLAARRAAEGPRAYCRAASTARWYTWSAGKTSSTSPMSRASLAGTIRPEKMMSLALDSPTSRGSRWVPPAPGMIPSLISGWPSRASSAAKRRSAAMASSHPPPRAYPLMAANVTLGISSTSENVSCMAAMTGFISFGESSAIILMSAPAANTFSPPHRTTARTSSRLVASRAAAWRSWRKSPL